MSTFRRVRRSVTVWAAIVAATGSIAGGFISKQGGDAAPKAAAQVVDCRAALQDTRDWAAENPEDAAAYAADGDVTERAPSLFSDEEREQCDGDPEALLERTPPPDATATRDRRGDDLRGDDMRGDDLAGQDLAGANLRGATLAGADLEGAQLEGADLRGADLRGATLHDVCLRGADLRDARLRGADVTGADLRGARIEHRRLLIGAKKAGPSACD